MHLLVSTMSVLVDPVPRCSLMSYTPSLTPWHSLFQLDVRYYAVVHSAQLRKVALDVFLKICLLFLTVGEAGRAVETRMTQQCPKQCALFTGSSAAATPVPVQRRPWDDAKDAPLPGNPVHNQQFAQSVQVQQGCALSLQVWHFRGRGEDNGSRAFDSWIEEANSIIINGASARVLRRGHHGQNRRSLEQLTSYEQ